MAFAKLVSVLLLAMAMINVISARLINQDQEDEDNTLPSRPLYVKLKRLTSFRWTLGRPMTGLIWLSKGHLNEVIVN